MNSILDVLSYDPEDREFFAITMMAFGLLFAGLIWFWIWDHIRHREPRSATTGLLIQEFTHEGWNSSVFFCGHEGDDPEWTVVEKHDNGATQSNVYRLREDAMDAAEGDLDALMQEW